MRIEKDTYSLLLPVFNLMDVTFEIEKVTEESAGKYYLFSCETKWLVIGVIIPIDGNNYTVTDLLVNKWVLVEGEALPTKQTVDIPRPYFIHGTLLMTNQEFKMEPNSTKRTPFLFNHDPAGSNKGTINPSDDATERIASCNFYFMCSSKTDWTTQQHFRYAVRPMRNFMKCWIKTLEENSGVIGLLQSYTDFDLANWGIVIDTKGNIKRLVDDRLSGCQLNIDIPFQRETGECCPDNDYDVTTGLDV